MQEDFPFQVKKVYGCGKTRGLRVVVDSQKLAYRAKRNYLKKSTGYRVYVTNPGVVTHKVFFNVDPSYAGEYDFMCHGIHVVFASANFAEWNKESGVRITLHDYN